jgi:hypothetical protein
MKRSPRRATDAGSVTDSLPLSGAHRVDACDDCGAEMGDWIVDGYGACLCLPCADIWEPYHLPEAPVTA